MLSLVLLIIGTVVLTAVPQASAASPNGAVHGELRHNQKRHTGDKWRGNGGGSRRFANEDDGDAIEEIDPETIEAGECTACADADCAVSESIKVGSLCAAELCVNGDPLVGGDGDPCTREELDAETGEVVSVRIANCCKVADPASCDAFRPSPCHSSECVAESEDDTHGYCRHLEVHGCCSCDADCPERECFERSCEAKSDAGPAAILVATPDGGLRPLASTSAATLADVATASECIYTPIDGCCARTSGPPKDGGEDDGLSCDGKCPDSYTAICDNGNECQCVKAPEFECLTNEDCRDDAEDEEAAEEDADAAGDSGSLAALFNRGSTRKSSRPKKHRRRKPRGKRPNGPCVAPVCSAQRICVYAFDEEFDADGDGVPCTVDCDDQDETKKAFTYCADASVDETTGYDKDLDGFSQCGAPVERFCLEGDEPDCPTEDEDGEPIGPFNTVDREQVVQSVINPSLLVLRYECDCCDDNADAGLDEPAHCARDEDGDGFFLCDSLESACIAQRTNATAVPQPWENSDAAERRGSWNAWRAKKWRDSQADAWSAERDAEADRAEQDESCREWAADKGFESPEQFITVLADEKDNCETCENDAEDQELADGICFFDPDQDGRVACPLVTIDTVNPVQQCCSVILGSDPGIQLQPLIDCCNYKLATGNYSDASCADAIEPASVLIEPILINQCSCPVDFVDVIEDEIDECPEDGTGHFAHTCYRDVDQDCVANCQKPLQTCTTIEDGEKSCAALGMVYLGDGEVDPLTDERCDCNDNDKNAFQWVACLPDSDGDGYPSCECNLVCASESACPTGTLALPDDDGARRRKRSLGALEHMLNKRSVEWGSHRQGGGSGNKGGRKPRHSGPQCAPADFEHQTCPDAVDLGGNCDCCDSDARAYPNSPWASATPVRCNDMPVDLIRDFNCDGELSDVVSCDTKPEPGQLDSTIFFHSLANPLVQPLSLADDVDTLGQCVLEAGQCNLNVGWLPQSDVAASAHRKRDLVVSTPPECVSVVPVLIGQVNGTVIGPAVGECSEAVIGCSLSQAGTCHEDCSLCVRLQQ